MATYQLIKDYTVNYFNSSIGKNAVKTFRKDDFIDGNFLRKDMPNDSSINTLVALKPDRVQTTIDGKMPKSGMVGQITVDIPVEGNIKELDSSSPSSFFNKQVGGYPVKSYILAVAIIGTIWYLVKRK